MLFILPHITVCMHFFEVKVGAYQALLKHGFSGKIPISVNDEAETVGKQLTLQHVHVVGIEFK